jgi:hypothetical protein
MSARTRKSEITSGGQQGLVQNLQFYTKSHNHSAVIQRLSGSAPTNYRSQVRQMTKSMPTPFCTKIDQSKTCFHFSTPWHAAAEARPRVLSHKNRTSEFSKNSTQHSQHQCPTIKKASIAIAHPPSLISPGLAQVYPR